MVVDTRKARARRVEFAARDPRQRRSLLDERLLHSGWIETDGAVRATPAQQVEVAALAQRIGARIAEKHEVAVLPRDRVDAAHDGRIERVAEVGDHREKQAAFGRAQIARKLVHAIAARCDRLAHFLARGLAHVAVAIEHARHRGDGHAGTPGNVGYRYFLGRTHGIGHAARRGGERNVMDYIIRRCSSGRQPESDRDKRLKPKFDGSCRSRRGVRVVRCERATARLFTSTGALPCDS